MKRSLAIQSTIIVLLTTVLFADSFAQSKAARPLTAPDLVEVQSSMSLSDFVQKRHESSLTERMRERFGSPSPARTRNRIIPTKPLRAESIGTMNVGPAGRSAVSPLDFQVKRSENGTISWLQGDLGQADVSDNVAKAWSATAYETSALGHSTPTRGCSISTIPNVNSHPSKRSKISLDTRMHGSNRSTREFRFGTVTSWLTSMQAENFT